MDIYAKGEQSSCADARRVELCRSGLFGFLLGKDEPDTGQLQKSSWKKYMVIRPRRYWSYTLPPTDAEVPKVATDLAADRFIAYNTWEMDRPAK